MINRICESEHVKSHAVLECVVWFKICASFDDLERIIGCTSRLPAASSRQNLYLTHLTRKKHIGFTARQLEKLRSRLLELHLCHWQAICLRLDGSLGSPVCSGFYRANSDSRMFLGQEQQTLLLYISMINTKSLIPSTTFTSSFGQCCLLPPGFWWRWLLKNDLMSVFEHTSARVFFTSFSTEVSAVS